MKVLLFILLAGCAVKCDENNYYVIEMLDDTRSLRQQKPFKVYWNVPTMQCKSKKIPFANLYEKFGIFQNQDDRFMGEKVTILYDPGLFPALLKNETSGRFKFRNGGVPQEGDLTKHLEAFRVVLDQSIPDEAFNGIGIIDFESWRPVFRQNFGVLLPYKDVSIEIERKLHWWWQQKWLEAEAKQRFEDSARTFMQQTIVLAKQLRPQAQWGFYGFPYCFNMASNNMVEACASNVPQENDNISWLFRESTALYPSVYSSASLSTSQLTALIRGRVREAARFNRRILPYFWYRYRDAGFLTQEDLNAALDTLYKSNASGIIIWGSSSDVNTVQKCTKLLTYIEQVMGPAIAKYTKSRRLQDDIDDSNDTSSTDNIVTVVDRNTTNVSNDIATTNSPITTDSTNSNRVKDLDPEYHWIPPENYTQAIKDHVAEEISKKITNYTRTEDRDSVLENNVLIDLILDSVKHSNVNESQEKVTVNNVDRNSTSKIELNNSFDDESKELVNGTTTEAFIVTELENTSVTNMAIPYSDVNKTYISLDIIPSTERAKPFEDTTSYDDTHKETSQTYESLNKEITEYVTRSTLPDTFTDVKTDISIDKNKKKSLLQDSGEGFFDITTETMLSTGTEELDSSVVEITENTVTTSGFTTENTLHNSKEDYTTEITRTESIETTTKDSHDVLNVFFTKYDEIDTYTTETLKSSQSTILKDSKESEADSNTTKLVLNVASEQNATKNPDFKEHNTIIRQVLDKNLENTDNVSTKALDIQEYTATEVTRKLEEENTSLMPSTTSPEQVVVYV